MHRTLRLQESRLDGAYASYPSGHVWISTPMFPNRLITSPETRTSMVYSLSMSVFARRFVQRSQNPLVRPREVREKFLRIVCRIFTTTKQVEVRLCLCMMDATDCSQVGGIIHRSASRHVIVATIR